MVSPAGDGSSPAPIDRPIVEFLQTRLATTQQVEQTTITDVSGHLSLRVTLATTYYPETVEERLLLQWYTNDDFKIHYREARTESDVGCRWDRHPNPHNTRDHFHPPTAPTPGDDDSWPTDYRDVLTLVLDDIEHRITDLWSE